MKAIQITQYGGPEVLTYADVADPPPAPARPSCSSPPPASTTWMSMAAPASTAPAAPCHSRRRGRGNRR